MAIAQEKLNVVISDEAYRMLQEIAKDRQKSIEEVLSDAISLENWVQEQLASGSRILVERKGDLTEITLK